ncbi:MAG: ADP-forming succinate--CoA ligase subunit beta [Salinispira sp.]
MNIHEYQGKQLFQSYGIDTGPQYLVKTPEEAREAWKKFGGTVVVKAQVLSGGRGKAGGVKIARTADETEAAAREIFALNIKGFPVEKILIVPASEIKQEFYLGITMDRFNKYLVLMISAEGGVDIEELAVHRPEAIKKFPIYPAQGIDWASLSPILHEIFKTDNLVHQARDHIEKLFKLYMESDCTLVEINPLAIVENDTLMALDSKINFDDNGLFKHPDIEALRNREENSRDEIDAKEAGLSFVSMDGNIGCIVNGAGLAMATMDIIKLFGGQPANFLDVGGSSNPNKMVTAIKIIMRNPSVKAILINIFGGITRGDDIAHGLLLAMKEVDINVPLVIRLIGTNDEEGRQILQKAGLETSTDLDDAVKRAVKLSETFA